MPVAELHFFAPQDINGATTYETSTDDPWVRGIYLDMQRDKLGSGLVTLARKVHAALFTRGVVTPEAFVRVLVPSVHATEYLHGFFLDYRQQKLVSSKEQGGEGFRFGGPGPKFYLTRAVLWSESFTGFSGVDTVNGVWVWPETAKAGRILNRLFNEDANNPTGPFLPDLTNSFTATHDSDGVAWVEDVATAADEFQLNISDDYLKILWQLENLGGLTTQMHLGEVGAPLLRLDAYQTFGRDLTGPIAADTVHFVEGVNILTDLDVEGSSHRKASHALVRGADGVYAVAERTSWDPGEYLKAIGYIYDHTPNPTILERAGLRFLRKQETGEQQIKLRYQPGFAPEAGLYMPGPEGSNGHLWLGDTVDLSTGQGTTTELDYTSEAQVVTGLEMELLKAARDDSAEEAALSWKLTALLNYDRQSNATSPATGSGGGDGGSGCCGPKLCRHSIISDFAAGDALGAHCTLDPVNYTATAPIGSGPNVERVRINIAEDVPAGRSIIVVCSQRGSEANAHQVVDQRGNTYTEVGHYAPGDSNLHGYVCTVTNDLSAGDWIGFEIDVGSGTGSLERGGKCITAYSFSGSLSSGTESGNATAFSGSPSVAVAGAQLIVAIVGWKGGASGFPDTFTKDADWTHFDDAATNVDGADSQQLFAGFRIGDTGGETYSGTIDQNRDWSAMGMTFATGSGVESLHAGRVDLVGTSAQAKHCDDTEHYHTDRDPTTSDNWADGGWRENTLWVNETTGAAFLLIDRDAGTWVEITATVAEIEDLPTAETDTSLVLHPDGSGGVAWGTDATSGGGGGGNGNLWTMSKSSSQTLTSNADTLITFDRTDIDGGGGVIDLANDRFVAPATGFYLAIAHWMWEATAPNGAGRTSVLVNGTTVPPLIRLNGGTQGGTGGLVGTVALSLTAGDLVTMICHPGAAVTPTARGNASRNLSSAFTLVRVT